MTVRDLKLRRELAQQLRWLVGGRITNDAFDDFLYERGCLGSDDRTVDELAWWGWTLYSDTHTYRLTGKHTVGEDLRLSAVRAVVFLRSNTDYEWPSLQEPFGIACLRAASENWWALTAIALLIALWNYSMTFAGIMVGPLALVAVALLGVACRYGGDIARR